MSSVKHFNANICNQNGKLRSSKANRNTQAGEKERERTGALFECFRKGNLTEVAFCNFSCMYVRTTSERKQEKTSELWTFRVFHLHITGANESKGRKEGRKDEISSRCRRHCQDCSTLMRLYDVVSATWGCWMGLLSLWRFSNVPDSAELSKYFFIYRN